MPKTMDTPSDIDILDLRCGEAHGDTLEYDRTDIRHADYVESTVGSPFESW